MGYDAATIRFLGTLVVGRCLGVDMRNESEIASDLAATRSLETAK